jgi:hypothetical protein
MQDKGNPKKQNLYLNILLQIDKKRYFQAQFGTYNWAGVLDFMSLNVQHFNWPNSVTEHLN